MRTQADIVPNRASYVSVYQKTPKDEYTVHCSSVRQPFSSMYVTFSYNSIQTSAHAQGDTFQIQHVQRVKEIKVIENRTEHKPWW